MDENDVYEDVLTILSYYLHKPNDDEQRELMAGELNMYLRIKLPEAKPLVDFEVGNIGDITVKIDIDYNGDQFTLPEYLAFRKFRP